MRLFQPDDGLPEKIGSVIAIIVSIGVLGVFVLVMRPVFGF
ncbi:hypothetical protein [Tianweitania aestuarii]|nr:hypothetical protein [Tianweitania aestuarii]